MNSLERVVTTLQHKEPDRVPWASFFLAASRRVYGATYAEWAQDGELAAKSMLQAQEMIGFDCMAAAMDLSVEAAGYGQEIIFPTEDTPHPNYDNPLIKTPEDYAKLEPFDPTKEGTRTKEMIKFSDVMMSERGSTVPVMALVYGPLGILSMLRSAEKLLRDCMKHKEEVLKGLEIVTEVQVEYVKALAKTGSVILFDTLFASQSMMSRKLWLETEGQFMPRLAETARECGAMVVIHNCGNGPYFDVQIETMKPVLISVAYPPDDCKDWIETKQKWGSKITLCGAVHPGQTIFLGTPQDVKEACKQFIKDMAGGGGFVLAPGCEFPPNGSLLNAFAFAEAVELYGRYL
jgi:uroporphyrinogen decarboxylase